MTKMIRIQNEYVNFRNVVRMVAPEKSSEIKLFFNFSAPSVKTHLDHITYVFGSEAERDSEVKRIIKELSE